MSEKINVRDVIAKISIADQLGIKADFIGNNGLNFFLTSPFILSKNTENKKVLAEHASALRKAVGVITSPHTSFNKLEPYMLSALESALDAASKVAHADSRAEILLPYGFRIEGTSIGVTWPITDRYNEGVFQTTAWLPTVDIPSEEVFSVILTPQRGNEHKHLLYYQNGKLCMLGDDSLTPPGHPDFTSIAEELDKKYK